MRYDKPHLNYEQQFKQLRDRGLTVDDPSRAMADLRRIGYYRLSAYTYPMRQAASADRMERFKPDARFADA